MPEELFLDNSSLAKRLGLVLRLGPQQPGPLLGRVGEVGPVDKTLAEQLTLADILGK